MGSVMICNVVHFTSITYGTLIVIGSNNIIATFAFFTSMTVTRVMVTDIITEIVIIVALVIEMNNKNVQDLESVNCSI